MKEPSSSIRRGGLASLTEYVYDS